MDTLARDGRMGRRRRRGRVANREGCRCGRGSEGVEEESGATAADEATGRLRLTSPPRTQPRRPSACGGGRGRGGRRSEGLPHYRRGRVTAVEDVAAAEVAAQTAASDVAADEAFGGGRGGQGRRCGQGHGMTAEVVAPVDVAASDTAGRACKGLQGSFCSAVCGRRNCRHSTPLVQLGLDLSVPNKSGHARNSWPTFGLPINGAARQSRERHLLLSNFSTNF